MRWLLGALCLLMLGTAGCFDPSQAWVRDLQTMSHWEEGDIPIAGTVKSVQWREAPGGPVQEVLLEGRSYGWCSGLFAPGEPELHPGDRFETVLHFRERTFNGHPAIWAPEMPCPGPFLAVPIAHVLAAVSRVAGGMFNLVGAVPGGAEYEYVPSEDEPTPLAGQTLRLLAWDPPANMPLDGPEQWVQAGAQLFVDVSGASRASASVVRHATPLPEFPVVETLALDASTSPGLHLTFIDQGRPGQLDLGDRVQVVGLADGFYALQLDPCIRRCGILFQGLVQGAGAIAETPGSMATFAHHELGGGKADIEVVATRGPELALDGLRWTLHGSGSLQGSSGARSGTGEAGSFVVVDGGRLGVLDAGDRIQVQASAMEQDLEIRARDEAGNRDVLEHKWTSGLGRPPLDLLWSVRWSGDEGIVEASGPLHLRELDDFRFGGWDSAPVLADGVQDACTGDRVLTFHDADRDGHLTTGDRVIATGTQEDACDLLISGYGGALQFQHDFPDPTPSPATFTFSNMHFRDFRSR